MIKNFKWLLLVSLTFVACNNDDEETVVEQPVTAGTANFSKYVALGNSLTAGFSDNALFRKGQEGSYANIMATQFQLVGGGDFKIPFMNDNVGGLLFGGMANPDFGPRLYLKDFSYSTPPSPNIIPVSGTPSTEVFNPAVAAAGPYNNTGVPGAKSFHLLFSGYGSPAGLATRTANPYYVRFAPNGTTSVLAYAVSQNPTFFSLWIGNNDVLGYATKGGVPTSQDPINGDDITPPATFEAVYTTLINTLTAGTAKGVVANIPYVNTVPFFTTVPYNPVPPLPFAQTAQAAQLNQIFGAINQIAGALSLPARFDVLTINDNDPVTIEKNNALLIFDETLTNLAPQITAQLTPVLGATTAGFLGNLYGRARHAKGSATEPNKDYILLTTRSVIGTAQSGVPASFSTIGVTFPLQDNRVLTASEVAELKTTTDAYNTTIKSLADAKGLAFVDANALLTQVANGGVRFGNFQITASFITGGAFSLDGVHPSPRGYALIANKFLEAINAKYGSTFKPVDLGAYSIQYPGTIN
jgi:hypothetical protein